MRKKVLFIISNLQSGGVSKSLVSLINTFDRKKYEVSLYITSTDSNVFGGYLPKDITVITNQNTTDLLSGVSGMKKLVLRFKFGLAFASLIRMLLSFISKPLMGEWLALVMPKVTDEEYDLIVDYNGQHQLYYMMNKLDGKKKVTFFHNDYSKWPYYWKSDKKYMPKVNRIFSISQVCVDALKQYFPDCKDKITLMENISSPSVIRKQAEEMTKEQIALIGLCNRVKDRGYTVLVTLGHLCKRKGSDFAIEAARRLKEEKCEFVWLFVGKVIEPDLLEQARDVGLRVEKMESVIRDSQAEGGDIPDIILCGIQSNPYSLIKCADVFVHPSRFEGKSIALDEAKILCKPIVVTNFSTVYDQFENRVSGTICEMDGESVYKSIRELMNQAELRDSYTTYLRNHVIDNTDEVRKLYDILES